ncbi:putative sensor histidine kinase pdtaS [Defluviimonas aquaemixtae]|uniref:histidine kinase n=1 Tax=Albidovulum aquaemixtae TaxID=1542388 RepID=A0A2R8BJ91_9RHOB|nr:sensor histidine kinase [Defluviimonas aquaemixtae]SPH23475.1 putative sensor histidine kinase pdtaS [Defluviimonas aquaemixtae]
MTASGARPGLTARLGFRIAFLLAAVLMPLTIISVIKSFDVVQETRARAEAAVMGETVRAASGELRLIQEARGAATVLAYSIWPNAQNTASCSALLQGLHRQETQYSLIAFVPLGAISLCNSAGRPLDFAEDPLFQMGEREPKTSFAVKPVGLVSGDSVLAITHPVFDEAGTYRGLLSVSLQHSGLRVAADSGASDRRPLSMVTFDHEGNVLTASRPLDDLAPALPRDRALAALAGDKAFSFTGMSGVDTPRVFSVVPLVSNELYALGSQLPDGVLTGKFGAVPVLFPVLMWLASVIVALFATERLVIRHIRKLSASLKSFASGNRLVGDIEMRAAPLELRDMAHAYERMTDTILHDEAELEDMVHQREVLLREVHHRVKNNLQLIASIMNMQMRRTQSPEAKRIMRSLQDRVMSLATIHRELYQTAGLSDVHSDELLSTIVRQIANLGDGPDRRFSVQTDFADIQLTPDQAVPLALLVAEAMANAMKYASGHDGTPARIWVTFAQKGETSAVLTVRNTVEADHSASDTGIVQFAGDTPREGLGTQLASAFAMQLGGQVERRRQDGCYEMSVRFDLRPLTEGEERSAPAQAV